MEGYLGTFSVDVAETPYKDWTPAEWALDLIRKYGGIDGEHHKTWVLDQVARVLNGAPVTVSQARWDNGHQEWRYQVGESPAYHEYVREAKDGEEGPDTYDWDVGIAP